MKLTSEILKAKAKELGMVYAENTTVNKNTEENTDNISNPTKNEDTTKEETTSLETTSSETTTQSETTTEEITTQPETTSQVLDERYTYQLTFAPTEITVAPIVDTWPDPVVAAPQF